MNTMGNGSHIDEGLVEQLSEMVDGTIFGTVRRHLIDPGSEVSLVIVVTKPHSLPRVAAMLNEQVGGKKKPMDRAGFEELVTSGVIQLVVPKLSEVQRLRQHCIECQTISDHRPCKVLLMPSAYIIQFRD